MRSRGFASSALFSEKRARRRAFCGEAFRLQGGVDLPGNPRWGAAFREGCCDPSSTAPADVASLVRCDPPSAAPRTSLRSSALCVYSLGLSRFPLSPFLLFHSEHRCARSGAGLLAPHPRQEASPPAPLLLPRFWRGLGGFFDFLAGMGDGAPSLDRLYQRQYLQWRP